MTQENKPKPTVKEDAKSNWPDEVRMKMIERSEFYQEPQIYQYGFYDGYQLAASQPRGKQPREGKWKNKFEQWLTNNRFINSNNVVRIVDYVERYILALSPKPGEESILVKALEDLVDAVPKQTVDADWWEDDLTSAMEQAREALNQSPGKQQSAGVWQLCPKCHGDGNLARYNSPSVIGTDAALLCDICNGAKVLASPSSASEKESDYWKERCEAAEKLYIRQLKSPDSEKFNKAFDEWIALQKKQL